MSIIVPVYNSEKYLSRCLSSLSLQTYQNLEIILIDDGSTDNSSLICDTFKKSHPECIVVHQKNAGLSNARNQGLNIAAGKYVFFLDSDDLIHRETIELLVKTAILTNSNIVACDYIKQYDKEASLDWSLKETLSFSVFNQPEATKMTLLNDDFSVISCSKLYSKALFLKTRFPEGRLHEDEFVTPYIVEKCQTYVRLYVPLYIYVQHEGSIMHCGYSEKSINDALDAQKKALCHFTGKYNKEIDAIVAYEYATTCSRLLFINKKNLPKNKRIELKKERSIYFKKVGYPISFPLKKKIALTAQRISPTLFWTICKKFFWFNT